MASIFSEDEMGIISFAGHSQVGQALGNCMWRSVPHPHMYTPSLWKQRIVIRMSGSALELKKGWHPSSVKLRLYVNSFIWGFHVGQTLGNYRWHRVPHPHMYTHLPCEVASIFSDNIILFGVRKSVRH